MRSRSRRQEKPVNIGALSDQFLIPPRLTGLIVSELIDCGLIARLAVAEGSPDESDPPLVPSTSTEHYTLGHVLNILDKHGASDFIPEFDRNFKLLSDILDRLSELVDKEADNTQLADIQFSQNE